MVQRSTRGAKARLADGPVIARHWRGDLSLGKSCWIAGALIGCLWLFLCFGVSIRLATGVPGLVPLLGCLAAMIAAQIVLHVWQFVGIWRCSGKHVSRGKRLWAVLAKLGVLLALPAAVLTMIINFDVVPTFTFVKNGMAYADKGDYDRAIANYDKAIWFNPYFAVAYRNRGIAYDRKGDHGRAAADYDVAKRLDPNETAPAPD